MKSILSDLAKQQIREIAKYIRKEFGKQRRDEFMRDIRETRRLIEQNPNISPIEPLLADLSQTYHSYVMNSLNKIIYRIDDTTIYIADFWDVRREPGSLKSQVE